MKLFDLTFSGTVLPERDPAQVKQDFARLFCIEDNTVIEEIFSGETIILRHNLDRKTAADNFRKITQLGGLAALVPSPKIRSVHCDKAKILDINADIPLDPAPEETTEKVRNRTINLDRLNRLKALAEQAKKISQQESDKLQQQRDKIDRETAKELSKIEKLNLANQKCATEELADLQAMEHGEAESLATELARVDKEKALAKDLANIELTRLDGLIHTSSVEDALAAEELGERLEIVRQTSEEDIRTIKSQLLNRQRQADNDISEIEVQIRAAHSESELEIAELEQQKNEVACSMHESMETLEQLNAVTQQQSEIRITDLKKRQNDIQSKVEQELSRLNNLELEIIQKHDQATANMVIASDQLEGTTQHALKRLETLELKVRRRQDEATNDSPRNISSGADQTANTSL